MHCKIIIIYTFYTIIILSGWIPLEHRCQAPRLLTKLHFLLSDWLELWNNLLLPVKKKEGEKDSEWAWNIQINLVKTNIALLSFTMKSKHESQCNSIKLLKKKSMSMCIVNYIKIYKPYFVYLSFMDMWMDF